MDTEPDPPIEAEARPAPTPSASGPVPDAATTGAAPGESAVNKDGRRSGRRLATVAGIVALIASAVFGLVQLGTFTASAPVLIDGTPDSWTASLALLRDLGRWDAASADERRQAAEAVDERMDAFRLDRIETFAAGAHASRRRCAPPQHEPGY